MRRAHTLLLLSALSLSACGSSLRGTRKITAADQAAPVEARFACVSALSFSNDGGPLHEVVQKPAFELRKGAQGPLLLDGEWVWTDHWTSEKGDHFFFSTGSGNMGGETIVAPDRQSALQFLWIAQTGDDDAFAIVTAPDGTRRPTGTPSLVSSCLRDDLAAKQLQEKGRVLETSGAVPMSSEVTGPKSELRLLGCSRMGKEDALAADRFLPGQSYAWMPSGILQGVGGKSYVVFGPIRWGAPFNVFAVEPDDKGAFSFKIGAVSYEGAVGRPKGKDKVIGVIEGTIAGRPRSELSCIYDHE